MLSAIPDLLQQDLPTLYEFYREELAKLRGEFPPAESEPSSSINWAKYPEVSRYLQVEVLRDRFRKGVLRVTSLHPPVTNGALGKVQTDERIAPVKQESPSALMKTRQANPLYKLWLGGCELIQLCRERLVDFHIKGSTGLDIPASITELHQTLNDLEMIRRIAGDMYELSDSDPEWVAKAQENEAWYKAGLRMMPDVLRQVELKLRHPDIEISMNAFGRLVSELALNPVHHTLTSDIQRAAHQVAERQRADREVAEFDGKP